MAKPQPGGHYRPRFTTTLRCINCVQEFQATRIDAKCCSPKCRKALERAMRKITQEAEQQRQEQAEKDRAARALIEQLASGTAMPGSPKKRKGRE